MDRDTCASKTGKLLIRDMRVGNWARIGVRRLQLLQHVYLEQTCTDGIHGRCTRLGQAGKTHKGNMPIQLTECTTRKVWVAGLRMSWARERGEGAGTTESYVPGTTAMEALCMWYVCESLRWI